jgi:hypothetical protein
MKLYFSVGSASRAIKEASFPTSSVYEPGAAHRTPAERRTRRLAGVEDDKKFMGYPGPSTRSFLPTAHIPACAAPMASLLKAQKTIAKNKRKAEDMGTDARAAADVPRKRNKQRVLLLSSRGITHRMRHLMNDLETLLPHVKKG